MEPLNGRLKREKVAVRSPLVLHLLWRRARNQSTDGMRNRLENAIGARISLSTMVGARNLIETSSRQDYAMGTRSFYLIMMMKWKGNAMRHHRSEILI